MEEKKQIFDMGNATSGIFRGNSTSDAIKEVYGRSASLFSDIIKSKLPETEKEYSLLDIGSSKGELLSDVLGFLPSHHFDITVTDTNPDAVAKNVIEGKKIVADAELLPFEDKSFDVVLMRYVLQFNLFEGQKKIIDEIARTVKQIAIVQHAGPDNKKAKIWREKVGSIFSNDKLPQIQRSGMYWSSAEEVEGYMTSKGIKFERVSSNEIHGLSQVYIERYSMNGEQASEVKKLIDDMDYLFQTTWIIYPKVKQTENIDYWEKTLQNPPKSYIKLFEQERDYLRKNVKKDAKVLDIGCGNGRNILSIIDITENVTGIDIDPKAVEDTKNNVTNYPKVNVVLGSVTDIPFGDKAFDVVIFSMTLVNLDNEKGKALTEMKRVAKDDAKIIVSVYSEKALEERTNMYKQVNVPIKSEVNGKFIFGIDGFMSEQFSIEDMKNMIEPLGLEIDNYEEVEKLAYIFTLKKV